MHSQLAGKVSQRLELELNWMFRVENFQSLASGKKMAMPQRLSICKTALIDRQFLTVLINKQINKLKKEHFKINENADQ